MLRGNSFMKFGWTFDPVAVTMLNFLSWAVPDLELVVASHRLGDPRMRSPFEELTDTNSKEFWIRLLEENNVEAPLHHDWHTPRRKFIPRPKHSEIGEWLVIHPEVKTFVTVEDDLNGGDVVPNAMRKKFHLVGEDYDNGLTWRDFEMMCLYMGLTGARDKYAEWSMTV